ncbi:MAG TPA: hypothetical protein VKA50_11335 [Gammaproteobacteria bacterium]|nr:hypothetical protein [Gammaproteobacteria bacterium]
MGVKSALIIAGIVVAVTAVVLGVYVGYAVYEGHQLDLSSKRYTQKNVPPILSSWSKEELLERSSKPLRKVVEAHSAQVDRLFQKLSQLGGLKSFGDVKGQANIAYRLGRGTVVTASYVGNAKFEHGEGTVKIRLLREAGEWKFLMFRVNSPIFLQ